MCRLLGLACLLFGLGCGSNVAESPSAPSPDAGEPDAFAPIEPRCIAPEGVSAEPHSIADVVALINALPKPVTVPCFVEALARPLSLNAARSSFSAQPADGPGSPRIFIFFPGLTLSVVPSGPGAHLLELGESRPDNRSLKAELELPIETQLEEASPYERVYYDDTITTCGFCHQGEHRDETIASPLAFISPAIRPRDNQRVALEQLAAEVAACDSNQDSEDDEDVAADPDAGSERERCAILHALFDRGPAPLEHDFPTGYQQF